MRIEPKFADGRVNPLVEGIIGSLTDALELTVRARRLHAFSVRAPSMIELYWGLWIEKNGSIFDDLAQEEKELRARWFGEIENLREMGLEQESEIFEGIKRNSVVFLADILENLVESFLHVSLEYYLPDNMSVSDVTGLKKFSNTYEGFRRAIRHWERSIDEKSRMRRLCKMIKEFFPKYEFSPKKSNDLDRLVLMRNELTHELIDIRRRKRTIATEEEVQLFFDNIGDFIVSLMKVFSSHVIK